MKTKFSGTIQEFMALVEGSLIDTNCIIEAEFDTDVTKQPTKVMAVGLTEAGCKSKIDAIKELRKLGGFYLQDAKSNVDSWVHEDNIGITNSHIFISDYKERLPRAVFIKLEAE